MKFKKDVLKNYNKADIYYSNNEKIYVVCDDKSYNMMHSIVEGTCIRDINEDFTRVKFIDGDYKQEFSANEYIELIRKSINIPNTQCNDVIDYNLQNNFEKIDYKKIFEELLDYAKNYNYILKKIFIHNENNYYELANTYNVYGYGYKKICAPGIEVFNTIKKSSEIFYMISNFNNLENDLKRLISTEHKKITLFNKNLVQKNLEVIILNNSVVGRLLNYFLNLLIYDNLNLGISFFSFKNLNKHKFSKLLEIQENSKINNISEGTVDGEGNVKHTVDIIKNGEILNIFNDCSCSCNNKVTTGSVIRENYKSEPHVKPNKIALKEGNQSIANIINKYNDLIIINDIQGFEESISLQTLNFNALTSCSIYIDREYIGTRSFQLEGNLNEIVKNIIDLSNDMEYSVDGSIICPCLVIENSNEILKLI